MADKLNLHQKLLAVRRQVTGLSKDGRSSFGDKFKYVSSNNILSMLRPLMDEQGIVLTSRITGTHLLDKWREGKEQKEHMTEVWVEFTWTDADNPTDRIVCEWYGQGLDTGEKGVGKALTYAEKYFLLKQFQIPTDEDDPDAGHQGSNGNGNAARQPQQQQPAAAPPPAPKYTLAPAAESKLATLMDALEMPDDVRRDAWATVTDADAARALKADLEKQLKDRDAA